ncbi:kunitz-type anticoagulant protein Ir-CPI-like isoform X1 [Oratosquilla oratoria]|uniref:kunitz-type anticoagulant protein Ir-CPI-like isoform X1 n=1 Tax=Oratosquilla oratoria TaxID=337810 RepID=UPI003F768302
MQVSLVITVALALCAVGYSNPSSDCSGTGKWRVECNWCHCKNGRPICTKEPCTANCHLKFDQGPCEALMYRWGFNSATQRCEEFQYGGCQGNENNFESLEDCRDACE